MQAIITRERPDTADALALINELEDYLVPMYPPENQFGFSPERLIKENVAFFVTRVDGIPAGCGGVKLFEDYGELKRMYVRPQFRGKGLAKLMLKQLEEYALQHQTTVLLLETGIYQPEAMGLYERMGYRQRGAFPPYDPSTAKLSRFYEKRLDL